MRWELNELLPLIWRCRDIGPPEQMTQIGTLLRELGSRKSVLLPQLMGALFLVAGLLCPHAATTLFISHPFQCSFVMW